MLAQEHFSTVDRQGYIDAGVREARSIREQLATNKSLCVAVQGPSRAGKSLFLDAIVHGLADDLSESQIPYRQHMIIEQNPDDALGRRLCQKFTINSRGKKIDFINLGRIDHKALRHLKRIARKPYLHLVSFNFLYAGYSADHLFRTLPMAALYQIDRGGQGLERDWTAWHLAPSPLKRSRG